MWILHWRDSCDMSADVLELTTQPFAAEDTALCSCDGISSP